MLHTKSFKWKFKHLAITSNVGNRNHLQENEGEGLNEEIKTFLTITSPNITFVGPCYQNGICSETFAIIW